MLFLLLPLLLSVFVDGDVTIPAVRVARLQLNYESAIIEDIQRINKWNSIMRNSVLASLRFINKHWLICGGEEKTTSDCGKAQITGEIAGPHHYKVNVTFIAQRDPIRNAKVDATSTVSAVTQIGLKGGIFQYTNALKVLGKPSAVLSFDEAFFCYKGALLVEADKCHLCQPGQFDQDSVCVPCGKGFYQPEAGRASCLPCPQDTTTSGEGTSSSLGCFHICPPGYFFDVASRVCEPCSLRGYQPHAGSDRCLQCPPNTVPLYLNSTSIDNCLENCAPGRQRSVDGSSCTLCALGSFKSPSDSVCMFCPPGTTTVNTGAKGLEQCSVKTCFPGSFLSATTLSCQPCDYGLYQDEYDARICKQCPVSTTTYHTGANSINLCQSTNQCKSGQHKCHWLAACMDLPDDDHTPMYACKCKPGYVGNGYTCSDICDGFCDNGATCLKTGRGEVKCICRKGFKGRRCETSE